MKRRILFVDDEPMILSGLQNLLRKHRDKWEMTFVDSGEKALERMASAEFDVVVSDMRMPKMDGATLLKRVQLQHPRTVRLVLSGHAELEAALRTVPIAHQFLSKPCEAAVLNNVIERACALSALLSDDAVRRVIGTISRLPSVPSTYLAVTRALENPNANAKDVAKLVEKDIALSAKVLQLVNSAFFGLPQRMGSIGQAVSYLGVNMVKRLVLSAETFAMFQSDVTLDGFSLEALQRKSMDVAITASKLISDRQKSEDSFMAGLLHDVGTFILLVHFPGHLKKARELAIAENLELHVAEQNLYGIGHAEVGAYLLGLWGLPYPIVEAVAHHHAPSRVNHQSFEVLDAVHVADALVDEVNDKTGARAARGSLDLALLESLGVADNLAAWRGIASQVVSNKEK